ncbi:chaperonin 10-like protein, partial [Ilyonectria destructans]
VWEGVPLDMPLHSLPIPTLLAETEALVRVTASSICGSDLRIYCGLYGSLGVLWTVGCEGMGYVLELGEAVAHMDVSDYVVFP